VSERFFSCSIAFLVAVTSAAIMWIGVDRLSWENTRTSWVVSTLELGDNHFAFGTGDAESSCFGSVSATLREGEDHYSINFEGWLSLALSGKTWLQEFRGEVSFNPLAQMGTSVLEIPIGDDSVRIGTKNINPITVLVFPSEKAQQPSFQQEITGPVELRREGVLFKITIPASPNLNLQTGLSPMLSNFLLGVKRDLSQRCSKGKSRPLDLTGVANSLNSLRSRITNALPLGTP
jgi:hypothetical protein